MKLKRIYVGDFGILRNQTLADLNPGIVVVGGKNRAGKSTFMEVLRNFPWGFSKGSTYPHASGGYEVVCDLEAEDGERYTVKLSGYAEPEVTRVRGKGSKAAAGAPGKQDTVPSMKELYAIDPFAYKNLFTIDLNQLQRVPSGLDKKADSEKLQAILLGAGLRDYVQIPRIEGEIAKEAEKIGGRSGSINVKMFGPYYSRIKEGLKEKANALGQVDNYRKKQDELSELATSISKMEEERNNLRAKIAVMDVLKSNYELFQDKKGLENSLELHKGAAYAAEFPLELLEEAKTLKNRYVEIAEELEKKNALFRTLTGRDDTDEVCSLLKRNGEKLKRFSANASGIKERISGLKSALKENETGREEILQKMKKVSYKWQENDWEYVKGIKTDISAESRIKNTIDDCLEKQRRKSALESELTYLKNQEKLINGIITDKKPYGMDKILIFALCWLASFIFAGAGLYFVAPLLSIIAAAAAVTGAILILNIGKKKAEHTKKELLQHNEELRDTQTSITGKEEELERLKKENENNLDEISIWKKVFNLSEADSPDTLKTSFLALQDIQDRMSKWARNHDNNNITAQDIRSDLSDYSNVLDELEGSAFQISADELIDRSDEIFDRIEKWHGYIQHSNELGRLEYEEELTAAKLERLLGGWIGYDPKITAKDNAINYILQGDIVKDYLQIKQNLKATELKLLQLFKTDQVREDINLVSEHEINWTDNPINEIEKLFGEYISLSELEDLYSEHIADLKKLNSEIERAKNARSECMNEINRLSATENLERAQKKIDEARSELKPLSVSYAIYNAASAMLEKVQKDFLEKTHDELLKKAAGIFGRMTGGDYARILPPPKLTDFDFQVETTGGILVDTANVLSRGTCEQLYLSVRLSRILETRPALPVIIDDSFVNFDTSHTKQVVKILSELSESHQIFILTCHPELVDYVAETIKAQYWKLESGSFSLSGSKELSKYLC